MMPSKRFDDMSCHDPPGRIIGRIDLDTGEFIPRVLTLDEEAAEREFARRRMYPEAHQEDPPGTAKAREEMDRGWDYDR